jgi:hypothetical protein
MTAPREQSAQRERIAEMTAMTPVEMMADLGRLAEKVFANHKQESALHQQLMAMKDREIALLYSCIEDVLSLMREPLTVDAARHAREHLTRVHLAGKKGQRP